MNTNKTKTLRFFKALMILSLGGLFLFLLIRAKLNLQEMVCTEIVVDITDESDIGFVRKADIEKIIHDGIERKIVHQKIENIDLKFIEEQIEKNQYIDNAEVFVNLEGVLKVEIVQKKPLYRIINNNNVSYYISKKAHKVPLSSNFTPRLIVATGYIPNVEDLSKDKINTNLKQLIDFIRKDQFWNAMIGHVEVKQNGDFVLSPKLKEHTVLLGNIDHLEDKFEKLKAFYQKALKQTDWTKYKQINLKFKGQLICSK